MHPIYQHIKQALKGCYPDSEASALARMLLVEEFGFSTLELFGGKDKEVSEKDLDVLNEMLVRLKNNEPIQYVLGRETFCGMTFEVDGNVLIPRPETQELVEWIADDWKDKCPCRMLDIGTGSGCIAISLVSRLPEADVEAWDISEGALEVAERNAVINEASVMFRLQDVLKAEVSSSCYEVIVSNPPYITEQEKYGMEANVLEWEPHTALFVPDADPLLFYRKIAELGTRALVGGGTLYFEINRAYGLETIGMLQDLGYRQIELRRDRFGNERMIKAIKP